MNCQAYKNTERCSMYIIDQKKIILSGQMYDLNYQANLEGARLQKL